MHIFIVNSKLGFLFIVSTCCEFMSLSSWNIRPDLGETILTTILFLSLVESHRCFFDLQQKGRG